MNCELCGKKIDDEESDDACLCDNCIKVLKHIEEKEKFTLLEEA